MKGKTAVVTGASSGIGAAIALELASHGANLAIIARRRNRLDNLAPALRGHGGRISIYSCDISNREQVQDTFERLAEAEDSIDYLVNCAGTTTHAIPDGICARVDALDSDLAVNVRGTFLCTVAGLPKMARGSAIVNIGSIRARTGTPSASIGYAAAKAAIINLTKSFAQQLAGRGIRVNCIAPGAIFPTDISKDWSEEKRIEIAASCPLGRLGSPEDIANAAYFLLSDLAGYITGHTLDVNGGRWMN